MAANDLLLLLQSLSIMSAWSKDRACAAVDRLSSSVFVDMLIRHIRQSVETRPSPNATRRFLESLGRAGSQLIRECHHEKPFPLPPLDEVVGSAGGLLLHEMKTSRQRSSAVALRSLEHFVTSPAGRAMLSQGDWTVPRPSPNILGMIATATFDAHDQREEIMGFLDCLAEYIRLPFDTVLQGSQITVTGFVIRDDGTIVACYQHDQATQSIPILDLPFPSPPVTGHEWIAAYRYWRSRRP